MSLNCLIFYSRIKQIWNKGIVVDRLDMFSLGYRNDVIRQSTPKLFSYHRFDRKAHNESKNREQKKLTPLKSFTVNTAYLLATFKGLDKKLSGRTSFKSCGMPR